MNKWDRAFRLSSSVTLLTCTLVACSGTPDDPGDLDDSIDDLYTGRLGFAPSVDQGQAQILNLRLHHDDTARTARIDTGSIYYFLGTKDNSKDLPCSSPEIYSYGGGDAHFCPADEMLRVDRPSGKPIDVDKNPIRMGRAYFTEWGGPPYGIVGLSGNMVGTNKKDMLPVISQLDPDFFSFTFPNGVLEPGHMQFAPLDDTTGAYPPIPLVNPSTIGYGYVANLQRMDFLIDGNVHTSVIKESDGVHLIQGGDDQVIAEQLVAFFDTGTTVPLEWTDGDISYLGDDTPAGDMTPEKDAVHYDEFRVVFAGSDGETVEMGSGDQKAWWPDNPQTRVLTMPAVPKDMKLLTPILGLNFIARWDFQFAFENGQATDVVFVPR